MARLRNRAPVWFWIIAIVLLLWETIGVYACVTQVQMGAASWPAGMEYDRRIYLSMPFWYNGVYALATVSGLLGALLLVLRRALAVPFTIVSLVAIVVMFGYVFATTDMIVHKGFVQAAGFPVVIFLLGVLAVWVSRKGAARGWIA